MITEGIESVLSEKTAALLFIDVSVTKFTFGIIDNCCSIGSVKNT